MEIRLLDKEKYAGSKFTASYKTMGYYDISEEANGFSIEYHLFDSETSKSFTDAIYSKWLDNPIAYGFFEDDKLLGYVEGFLEEWNNRYRISNIIIFEKEDRLNGIGSSLMEKIIAEARNTKARMVVLETQSCNEVAIAFYQKWGFKIIGFDLYSYSNEDPQKHEIRIEMGKML